MELNLIGFVNKCDIVPARDGKPEMYVVGVSFPNADGGSGEAVVLFPKDKPAFRFGEKVRVTGRAPIQKIYDVQIALEKSK